MKTFEKFFKNLEKFFKGKNTPKNLIYYKTIAFWLLFWFFTKILWQRGLLAKGQFFISDGVRLIKKLTALFYHFIRQNIYLLVLKGGFKELKRRVGVFRKREKTDNFFVKKPVVFEIMLLKIR